MQQVALALDADFDAPDGGRVVEMARELDQLCARFDVQIGMTLNAPAGTWDAARVDLAAQAAGLVAVDPLCWAFVSADGRTLFTLRATALPTSTLALELDVPLVPVAADPLRTLLRVADTLAMDLGARLVDDNRRPVNAASLSGVAEQLDSLYTEMRAAGIEPGSARAQRLYA
ncbi:MAG: cell division protein ZipA C-terminal FtsZ-binding domain-containing protein [Burkholderiaceae bacterium]|nr:cell division protein ZipA C-terminal FtsZ-binding domain-containing protein [Burkholderiaceae bacterium]